MLKIGSIASGMGLHLHGLKAIGCVPVWAVEMDSAIAHCYSQNHQSKVIVSPVQQVDPQELEDIDLLTITLSCKNASTNKGKNRGETDDDLKAAIASANILKTKIPKYVMLENVWTYRNFASFQAILFALEESGYYYQYYRFNCKDWGISQNRDRLYLLAIRHGSFFAPTPPQCQQKGWYEAIKDLIPSLPEVRLTNWQLRKFPVLPKIALLKRVGGGRDTDRIYSPNEASFTIRAVGRRSGYHSRIADAVIGDKVLSVTPRACLRFFGDKETADKIWLPHTKSLAMEVVGNGASWVMFRELFSVLVS